MAQKIIKDNVKGAIYDSELKRRGDYIIGHAFFDPTKNSHLEYTSKYTLNHIN